MNRRDFLQHSAWLGACLGSLARSGWSGERDSTLAGIEESERLERIHRELTVVDSYSACVELDELEQAGTDVVIQAVDSEELLVQTPPPATNEQPPAGVDLWENVFDGPEIVQRVVESIDAELQAIERASSRIALARSVADIHSATQQRKIALVLMLKSGWIADSLAVLRFYYRLGVRVMAPCHLAAFSWADSSAERNRVPGLSAFGREVVRECNRLGILVDLSHASDDTVWHALDATRRPVIASHSRCRALSGSFRDLTDDMIRAIAKGGGVVSILAGASRTSEERTQARLRRDRRLAKKYPNPFDLSAAKKHDAIVWGTKLNVEHIDHAVQIAGIDHVAIASHCISVPQWREFTEVLVRHGYSVADVKKLLGANVLRLLEATIG